MLRRKNDVMSNKLSLYMVDSTLILMAIGDQTLCGLNILFVFKMVSCNLHPKIPNFHYVFKIKMHLFCKLLPYQARLDKEIFTFRQRQFTQSEQIQNFLSRIRNLSPKCHSKEF